MSEVEMVVFIFAVVTGNLFTPQGKEVSETVKKINTGVVFCYTA